MHAPAASRAPLVRMNRTGMTSTILCPRCHKPNASDARFCAYCGHDTVLNNDTPSDDLRYWITRVIKEGGQGAVYAGVDQHGKVYAIKEMLDRFHDPRERDEAITRFNSEAELLQRLSHPRIPRVYSHFTDEGRHYLTMDFVQGEDLDALLEKQPAGFPEAQVLDWAMQISDVLTYLHANGLIYRDIKPSNIMIEADGTIKLVDFGIAKLFKPAERGTQIGTPGYSPPEQYQGLATPQSDIYALAATLHHLLTGRDPTEYPPFSFPPVRDLRPEISQRTADAISKGLQMKPEARYATMPEFRAALRPLIGTRTNLQEPQQVRRQATPTVQIKPATSTPPPAARQAAPPTQPAPPAQRKPAPPAQPPASRGGIGQAVRTIFNILLTLLAILVIAGMGIAIALSMNLFGGNAPAIPRIPGIQQPTTPAISLQTIELDVRVELPAGSTDTDIREALRQAYRDAVAQQYPGSIINPNIPISIIGSYSASDEVNGVITYSARMSGKVQVPSP